MKRSKVILLKCCCFLCRNSSKNAKPAKKSVEEKPVRLVPREVKPSIDLPAVQCKDTLLLDYDYDKQYSKRSLASNWDKYNELPDDDDDDDNGQLSAADFEQLLSASKSIGDHFTFAAEKSWLQSSEAENAVDESSMTTDLFKLNIANLKNGISHLPFYLRQDLPTQIFTMDEISDMDYRANFFDIENGKKPAAKNQANQNLLNLLTSDSNNSQLVGEKSVAPVVDNAVSRKPKNKSPTTRDDLDQFLKNTQINREQTPDTKSTPTPSKNNPIKPSVSDSTKVNNANNSEDIQDWLDDILNES